MDLWKRLKMRAERNNHSRLIKLRSIPPETSLDKIKKIGGMHGFHLRLGGGEPAKLEWFGGQEKAGGKEKTGEPVIKEKIREPVIDIFDEKDRVIVIAELVGVNEKDVDVETKGNELTISASSADRKYSKTVRLPFNIKRKPKQRYKNGILELVFKKGV